MAENKFRAVIREKVELDENGKYMIEIKGKKVAVELNDKEINTLENWFHLFSKHELRFEIWNILELFSELNLTQMSKLVEQSKSTVSRHLNLMEEDLLILSRKEEIVQKGKIPPKLYSINRKLLRIIEFKSIVNKPPTDQKELVKYYEKEIRLMRFTVYRFTRMLNLINPFLDYFESQLGNVGKATKVYKKYLDSGKIDPFFSSPYYINEKYHERFLDIYIDFIKKRNKLLMEQNSDFEVKDKTFMYMSALLPTKEYLKLYRENKTKKIRKPRSEILK
jgi:DNA-binding transcriptional ArsR family regulator